MWEVDITLQEAKLTNSFLMEQPTSRPTHTTNGVSVMPLAACGIDQTISNKSTVLLLDVFLQI
jgi:hypothetical protein